MRPPVPSVPFATIASALISGTHQSFNFLGTWQYQKSLNLPCSESMYSWHQPPLVPQKCAWYRQTSPLTSMTASPLPTEKEDNDGDFSSVSHISVQGSPFHYQGAFYSETSEEQVYSQERPASPCWYGHPSCPHPCLMYHLSWQLTVSNSQGSLVLLDGKRESNPHQLLSLGLLIHKRRPLTNRKKTGQRNYSYNQYLFILPR